MTILPSFNRRKLCEVFIGSSFRLFLLLLALNVNTRAQHPSSPSSVYQGPNTGASGQWSVEQRNALSASNQIAAPGTQPVNQQFIQRAHGELDRGMRFIKGKQPRYDEAEKAFQAAITLYPPLSLQAYSGLGYVYTATGRYDEAEKTYQMLINRWPLIADNYFNLGAVYFYRGDKELARQQVEKLTQMNRNLAKRLQKFIDGQN